MNLIRQVTPFAIVLVLFTGILLACHHVLLSHMTLHLSAEDINGIHVFLFLITLISYFIVVKIGSVNKDRVGFAFLGLSFIKMMAAVAYLFPLIKSDDPNLIVVVSQFMALYFLELQQ